MLCPRARRLLAFREIRNCDLPLVKTCFAVGAVLRVCDVFRFLLEHQSLGVTLVLPLLVRAGSVISRPVLRHGRDEAGAVESSRWQRHSLRSVTSGLLHGRRLCGRLTYRCDGQPW